VTQGVKDGAVVAERRFRVSDLQVFLGYLSGLRFVDPNLSLAKLVPTMIVVNICDAIMCRLFARNNGYPQRLWALIGFVFGVWAVACLIVLPKREARP
jgi:hypothetical protein